MERYTPRSELTTPTFHLKCKQVNSKLLFWFSPLLFGYLSKNMSMNNCNITKNPCLILILEPLSQ